MQSLVLRNLGCGTGEDAEWNDLLRHSRPVSNTCQAEVLASFQANFAPRCQLLAVIARDDKGTLVAGLPLILKGTAYLFSSASTVSNEWCQCGNLLLRPDVDQQDALLALLSQLSQMRFSNLWLDWVNLDDPVWREFCSLARDRGWGCRTTPKFDVGLTRLPSSWTEYEDSLSKNSRKKTRAELKRLSIHGELRLEVIKSPSPCELARHLRTVLEIESRSWKGAAGTAVACQPRARAFLLNAAHTLNRTGNLRLFLLRFNQEIIAFDLGEQTADVYRSWKVSYLPEFSDFSPGHVLNQLVLRHYIENSEVAICDSIGPMTKAIERWSNDTYRLGKIVLAPKNWLRNPSGHTLLRTLTASDRVRKARADKTLRHLQ